MNKSLFCIGVICLLILLTACPQLFKGDDKNKPQIEEITTMSVIEEEMRGNNGDNTDNNNVTAINTQPTPPTTPPPTQQVQPTTPTRPTNTTRTPEQGDFTVQFMSLRDRSRVDEVRRILAAAAYFTEVQDVEINGEKRYRLRLAGSYSRSYATYLAEKIKTEIKEIDDYWVTRR